MFYIYILFSGSKNKYYIGHTEDLDIRLKRHNSGLVRSTKGGKPWIMIYTEVFQSKRDAYNRELQIKSYKGGEAFKNLLK
ncbi:GIY-YIG nuclease family protein [Patescibacteria group bacterium]|nr:MAG: GIY-YIG nuclease family protein [Patescibacteria group bacterium]